MHVTESTGYHGMMAWSWSDHDTRNRTLHTFGALAFLSKFATLPLSSTLSFVFIDSLSHFSFFFLSFFFSLNVVVF
ncbi:hypothetical protein BCR41DRAFT_12657 [Lobosporangium transversale]|uniref:Uncharacterized protein n=1 Tax=Lobosporangium transversale TaxID=64571 RepID=A0A1Y2GT75_9FUNG|nr:hypothetical protein BCR41DRAFT_12657 [Lobosporangium transversale]ORZ22688.1 hypothetical protein BCR41DRAFT_12657 [Lobosporangium transversale]|eukprot:XP_021883242.1 hypothetical protein BCR41DRAFT_12657 [Lobosporangium transversale]